VTILRLSGRLVFGEEREAFRNQIKKLLADDKSRIIVNMAEVTYIDDSIGNVLEALVSTRKRGGELKLVNPSKSVEEVLSDAKLNTVFQVYPTEEEALAGFM